MIPCAISGSRSLPRSLVNVIVIVIWIIGVDGLVGIVWIVSHHHVFSPDIDLLLGLIYSAAPLRPCALTGTRLVMLAVLLASHEPLDRQREAALALRVGGRPGRLLLGHRLSLGVRIPDDCDRSLLHLLLRCAPTSGRLILRPLA